MGPARRFLAALLLLGLAGACGDDGGSDYGAYMDDDIPAGNQCTTTGTVFETETESCSGGETTDPSTTTGEEDQCQSTADCADGQSCAALFDGNKGPQVCLPACLEEMDEDFWCADAEACCDPNAICTQRGYCVSGGADTGTTTTSATGTTGATDTGSTGGGTDGSTG